MAGAGPFLAEQRRLLQRATSFRLLFAAALASGIGTWMAVIALTVDVFDRTGSAKWVSALLIADFLPAVVVGLALAPVVDRLSRRGLMVGADLARLVVFAALPLADSAGQVVALAAIAGVATGLFRPASYAGLPNTVQAADLPLANSLLRAAEYLTIVAGTFAGGVIVETAGPAPAYWLNAATFLVSAALLRRIPARALQAARSAGHGHWRELAEGLALVVRSPALLTVLVVWNLALLAAGATNVAEVALAKVSFSAGDLGFGLLWTATGMGQAAGSLLAAGWLERRGLRAVYAGSVGLMAAGALAAAASPNVWVALACVAAGGAGNGAAVVYNSLLVQRGCPDHLRGRAFTVLMGATFAAMGLGMAIGGPLTDRFGARWVYAGAGALTVVAALVARAMSGRVGEQEEEARAVSVTG
jgi:MFS family permease